MIQLRRILLPTDFSKFSVQAAAYACGFAEQFAAELHVLHVLETHLNPAAPQFGMGLAIPKRVTESEQSVREALKQTVDAAWQQAHPVIQATAKGSPFVEIVRYAKTHSIDLIVIGTHGRSAIEHVLMGSVAERVVQHAPCPVLAVRADGHQFVAP